MNDKEAFDQWLKTKSWIGDHAKMWWCLEAWRSACEYKQKEIDKLEAENEKLKEQIKNIWKEAESFFLDD